MKKRPGKVKCVVPYFSMGRVGHVDDAQAKRICATVSREFPIEAKWEIRRGLISSELFCITKARLGAKFLKGVTDFVMQQITNDKGGG